MSSEQVIAPCPFCGGEAKEIVVHDGWAIECAGCLAQAGFDVTEHKAVRAWNRRLSTPANLVTVPASELRAMREEIERLSTASTDDAELIESLEVHGWHKATATIRQLQARNAELAAELATWKARTLGAQDAAIKALREKAK